MKSSTRELILATTCAVLAVNSCRLEERIIQIENRSRSKAAQGGDDENAGSDDRSEGEEDHNQADDNLVDGVVGVVGHNQNVSPWGELWQVKNILATMVPCD